MYWSNLLLNFGFWVKEKKIWEYFPTLKNPEFNHLTQFIINIQYTYKLKYIYLLYIINYILFKLLELFYLIDVFLDNFFELVL